MNDKGKMNDKEKFIKARQLLRRLVNTINGSGEETMVRKDIRLFLDDVEEIEPADYEQDWC